MEKLSFSYLAYKYALRNIRSLIRVYASKMDAEQKEIRYLWVFNSIKKDLKSSGLTYYQIQKVKNCFFNGIDFFLKIESKKSKDIYHLEQKDIDYIFCTKFIWLTEREEKNIWYAQTLTTTTTMD